MLNLPKTTQLASGTNSTQSSVTASTGLELKYKRAWKRDCKVLGQKIADTNAQIFVQWGNSTARAIKISKATVWLEILFHKQDVVVVYWGHRAALTKQGNRAPSTGERLSTLGTMGWYLNWIIPPSTLTRQVTTKDLESRSLDYWDTRQKFKSVTTGKKREQIQVTAY
jgi:hypothetical protein